MLMLLPVAWAMASVPTFLQVNYKPSPALGVGPKLRFSWAVPPSASGVQKSYSIVIAEADSDRVAWRSGVVQRNDSVNIEVDGRRAKLNPGTMYKWTVACDGTGESSPASFVTSLWDGFDDRARWIWASNRNVSQHYANFRSSALEQLKAGKSVKRALLFVTAWQEPTMLASYKFYVNGVLVSLGPGRGESNVMAGNATFLRSPYETVDITAALERKPQSILAIEAMAPLFQTPCDLHACRDINTDGGGVLAQIILTFGDNSRATLTTDASTWHALPADEYRNPSALDVKVNFLDSSTAYAKIMENVDATKETVGWRTAQTVSPAWPLARAAFYQQRQQLVAKMARPLAVSAVPEQKAVRFDSHSSSFFVDFGREFQGGVVLTVGDGTAGAVVRFISGELLLANGSTDASTGSRLDPTHTWGYSFNWTLREGPQVITQHNYMTFRYLAVKFIKGPVPANFSVSAWRVNYEYIDGDSHFVSSDAMLNQVHELSRWTLEAGVVDTLTDSNTRERRPYECDGLIAGANRALVQSDQMLNRHSYAWVLEVPTWPVTWMQMSALLAWQDYMATGSVDLFTTFEDRIYQRTQVDMLDSTGLVNTTTGRHLYSWDPPATRDMFVNSGHSSVCNAYTIRGLEVLAEMAAVSGSPNASLYARQAASIKAAFVKQLWDADAKHFCDGPCDDPKVKHHNGVTTNYFTAYHNLVPPVGIETVWSEMAAWGLKEIGDFGSHVFLNALSRYAGDNGTAMFNALTKCDENSWCNEIRTYNATMTEESIAKSPFQSGQTMSHPWGTGALSGVIHGIMGVQQTSATWSTFMIRPLLASLEFANATVPTIRGPIVVTATPTTLAVEIPCNTKATLCLQRHQQQAQNNNSKEMLLLDGKEISSKLTGQHLCTMTTASCAMKARVLEITSQPRHKR